MHKNTPAQHVELRVELGFSLYYGIALPSLLLTHIRSGAMIVCRQYLVLALKQVILYTTLLLLLYSVRNSNPTSKSQYTRMCQACCRNIITLSSVCTGGGHFLLCFNDRVFRGDFFFLGSLQRMALLYHACILFIALHVACTCMAETDDPRRA